MARARRASDDVYNARRRYRRQAERLLKRAEAASGEKRAQLEREAQIATEKAIATYENKSKIQGRLKPLAERFGVSKQPMAQRSEIIAQSETALANFDLKNAQGRAILSGNIGQRFYAGLVDIWRGSEDREQAVLDYFGVSNLLTLVEILRNEFPDLMSAQPNSKIYPTITAQLQEYVSQLQTI